MKLLGITSICEKNFYGIANISSYFYIESKMPSETNHDCADNFCDVIGTIFEHEKQSLVLFTTRMRVKFYSSFD